MCYEISLLDVSNGVLGNMMTLLMCLIVISDVDLYIIHYSDHKCGGFDEYSS